MNALRLLCIIIVTLCTHHAVLAEWTYPPLTVPEGNRFEGFPYDIGKVKSSNEDVDRYTLSGVGVDIADYDGVTGKFDIVASSGVIRQLIALDREAKPEYTLTIKAYDSDVQVEDDHEITIVVTDINDNNPVFDVESLTGSVLESSDASSPSFMTVSATDLDVGYNSQIRYSIVEDSDTPVSSSPRFSINRNSGAVSVQGALDYEQDEQVTFMVLAKDGGDNPDVAKRTTTATVTVNIQDANDNAPVYDPEPADRPFSELSPVDSGLYNIYADDADQGVNKKVYFRITDGNIGSTFKFVQFPSDSGKSRGELQLAKPLDFESGSTQYDLTIQAYNGDAEHNVGVVTTDTHITIKVIDENEPPTFVNTPYTAYISEEEAPENNEAVPVIQVTAEDKDFNGNQTVTYSVNDPQGWFQINNVTGQVSRIAAVDREAAVVVDGVYNLVVVATDNYDHATPKSMNGKVAIQISDINDNPPETVLSANDLNAIICEQPQNNTVILIEAKDPDSDANGPPFTFLFDNTVDSSLWGFEDVSPTSKEIVARFSDYNLDGAQEEVSLPFTITDSGSPSQTGTATATVTICTCNSEGIPSCSGAVAAGFPVAIIIAIIAVLLLIIILIFALVAYKRRQAALVLKEPFFDDEDDIRENVQVYQEEGGEEDQDAYDLSALRAPLLEDPNQPVRIEKPLQQAPRQPRGVPDDIGDYIGDAKDQADADPSAPPFDSLLVFDYEGAGSDAGSLSSINTATTDGSMDYDYLNNWGPRFKKLADMYNDGSDSE